jgi:redox-sensitive bicupin YhaK (pirin superfamily)
MGVLLSQILLPYPAMIKLRRADERRHVNRGWLDSYFTFSFADYHDPAHNGFRALFVMNEDTIAPGKGFGPHAHRDMEILTYVLEGHLLHRDSMGEQHVVGPNEIQMMSVGSGVVHSEFNASETEPVHLFQIWILPEAEDLDPSYQQVAIDPGDKLGRLRLLAAPEGNGERPLTTIRQRARVYAGEFRPGDAVRTRLDAKRYAWVQVVKGNVKLNDQALGPGDAVAVSEETELQIAGLQPAGGEILLFDLP